MKSWKTSTLGVIAILSAISAAVSAVIDGNPATNPDWTATLAAVAAGWGLLCARDKNVSTEQQTAAQ